MPTLLEKAKTSQIIAFEWDSIIREAPGATYDKEYKNYTKKRNKEWVRLEAAQHLEKRLEKAEKDATFMEKKYQEMFLKLEHIESENEYFKEQLVKMEKEREEWKQKLPDVIHRYLIAYPLATKLDREVCKVLHGIAKDMGLK